MEEREREKDEDSLTFSENRVQSNDSLGGFIEKDGDGSQWSS